MSLTITQVDAFTDRPFAGNPAAVCVLPEARDEVWMQHVAREMNLSETAFLVRSGDGYDLRWFTPTVEIDLCGHATLASAHVLWQTGQLPADETARFSTRSGLLTAKHDGDWIVLDFPALPPTVEDAPDGLLDALGLARAESVGKSRFDYLVQVESEEIVLRLKPDFGKLRQVQARGVMVTSRASMSGFDIVSRFFAPSAGVDEDPVTGSAHCCLGPFWLPRLNKDEMVAYQASQRGGVLRVQVAGDRVLLGGQAVTVMRAELADGV
jgi:PhzF family phenazine biosynthesis protein